MTQDPRMALTIKDMALTDPDAKRAEMLARRMIEGLATLDDEARLRVFTQLSREFCITCGKGAPQCTCGGAKR